MKGHAMMKKTSIPIVLLILLTPLGLWAENWPGFRGPGSLGVSPETGLTLQWSDTENLQWKVSLPGPGSSSPIVWGDKVYVTCYSGYGLDKENPGDMSHLKRHLRCLRVKDGSLVWDTPVDAVLPEDPYKGRFQEHGYASQTPITNGKRIFVFMGKTGVLAFDMQGQQLWQRPVGAGSDRTRWGSASSPTLFQETVYVNAWDESKTLYALRQQDGTILWKKDLSEMGQTYCTPVVADLGGGRADMIFVVPKQVLGLDPQTGQTRWSVRTAMDGTVIPMPVVKDGIAYVHGGGPRGSGSVAIRLGGEGDVTDTHVLWSNKDVSSPPTPVLLNGSLYWVNGSGEACCADAQTGKIRYQEKLPGAGRFAVYASVIAAEGRLYAVMRQAGTVVLAAEPTFRILAHNQITTDDSDFNASPAIANGRLLLRSDRYLYCF
jgi:outer membrane protein assembly factor BamB